MVGNQLLSFVDKFRVDRDSEPSFLPMPEHRSELQEEIELRKLISSLDNQILELGATIKKRKDDEKEEEEAMKRAKREEEKRTNEEEKTKRKKLVLTLKSMIKNRAEYLHEAEPDQSQLDRIIGLRLRQRDELAKAVTQKSSEVDAGCGEADISSRTDKDEASTENLTGAASDDPKLPSASGENEEHKHQKHPDEVEWNRLTDLKRHNYNQLSKLVQREDARFDKERRKINDANEKLSTRSTVRRSMRTLGKAIQLEWNKPKIDELTQKLERIRSNLYSQVMMSIREAVGRITETTNRSDSLLAEMTVSQARYHIESTKAFQAGQSTVAAMIQSQTSHLELIDDIATKRHSEVLQAINSFADVLSTSDVLFPALPRIITRADPSLKLAALIEYEAIENAVLSALYFRRMDTREGQIQEAFKNTFSWIFEDPMEHQKPWSNFRQWLEDGSGCYWIAGKAGCGKSTLMKFLGSDTRTSIALEQWAGKSGLITASYFFWMTGTNLQKNQEGLLRSLLHTILSQRRDLIARVFPKQYDAMMTK